MRKLAILFALILSAALMGCSQSAPDASESIPVTDTEGVEGTVEDVPEIGESIPVIDGADGTVESVPDISKSIPMTDGADGIEAPAVGQVGMVYIGTKAEGFTDYPIVYDGELTPEKLIQGIADLTGWNLTLAESVTSGKGGMSVCLSDESALFTGPPSPQREQFFVYDVEQLAEMVLDSIQKTLQMGFTGEGGDPDALDIWYYMADGRPLEIPALGFSWTIDQPYQWTARMSGEPPAN